MMQIVYFSQKEQFLVDLANSKEETIFIAPSPAKADGLRSRLVKFGLTYDVLTVSKFTTNLVSQIWSKEEAPLIKRKSELLLVFGILKEEYLPDLGFEQFIQAYNLFSDLRSFTLNEDALSLVIDEQPEIVRKAVKLFWKILEITNYLDEHGAYHKITEKLRSQEEAEYLKKTYVFWGFQYLNGQQIDLLKALSIRYDVIVPFPTALRDKLKQSDWLTWLKENKVKETELPLIEQNPNATWLRVNSRNFSRCLKSNLQKNDQIVLGVSKLSHLHLNIVPSQIVSYKIPLQIVKFELSQIFNEINELFQGFKTIEEVELFLNEKTKNTKSLKMLKAVELYQDALGLIKDLTDRKIVVDDFFLKLLFEVVSLNQPRTSFVPISSSALTIDLKDMSTLDELQRDRRVILCIDDRFDEIQSLGQNYTETIQKALAALGPLKRNELELLFKQWEFKDFFSQTDVLVMMPESTLEHSLIWKRLFQGISLVSIENDEDAGHRNLKDYLTINNAKVFDGSFSASKIQTYLDCPKKFYFRYIDQIFPTISLKKDFDSLLFGVISHKIIEEFYKRKMYEKDLPELIKEIMHDFMSENKLELSRETYLERELILNHRSLNGVRFLKNLEQVIGEKFEWIIEKPFNIDGEYILTGKIDCIGVSSDTVILVDFKSTASASSSNSEIESFENLQLWIYAKAASKIIPDFNEKHIVMGFISLDKPTDSNLLITDQDLSKKIKASKICKQGVMTKSFTDSLKESEEMISTVVSSIRGEVKFLALPRKIQSCRYCDLNSVCVKSEIVHE